jgi:hypothetical protein
MNLFRPILVSLIITGLIIAGCSKDSSSTTPPGTTAAVYTLGGAPGSCSGFTLGAGAYVVGTALTGTNTATVTVNVSTVGTYTITTPTVNGISFSKSGTFASTGTQTVILTGTGTPAAAGAFNYSVTLGSSSCSFSVTATGGGSGAATFTLGGSPGSCTGFTLGAGTYVVGTALGATNTVSFQVAVATAGTYSITTPTVNGISFSKSGTFASTGAQTVVLTGSGTPAAAGAFNYSATAGANSCAFSVTATGGSVVTSWQFNSCDALTAEWEIAGGEAKSVQTTNQKEGTGWIEADMATTDGLDYLHFIDRRPVPLSTGVDSTNGQLHLWFYVSDASQIDTTTQIGQIELTSSGQSDHKEYNWTMNDVVRISSLHNGWNEIKLDFSTANIADGSPDLKALNLFRIYFWLKSTTHPDLQFGLDDISILKKP